MALCKIVAGSEGNFSYSTTEQRVGTWIDGSPVYAKVVQINNPTNEWNTLQSLGIANLSHIIESSIRCYVDNSWCTNPFEANSDNTNYYIRVSLQDVGGFRFQSLNVGTINQIEFTLVYTKTA